MMRVYDAPPTGAGLRRALHNVRLNSAVGYITPKDMLAGRQHEIHAERDRKLEAARKQRQIRRQQAACLQIIPVGRVLPVMGSSNRTSARVWSLKFRFADDSDGNRLTRIRW
jgi:hypothetical protein